MIAYDRYTADIEGLESGYGSLLYPRSGAIDTVAVSSYYRWSPHTFEKS